ncbi:uncharacterized protein BX664DRAFT_323435, partial [Halteromyces radiatus]|uniref:uncharacterized protein n=1 Tax=Halteromyces radiatus TaxID=101107 RepID=UPI00221E7635
MIKLLVIYFAIAINITFAQHLDQYRIKSVNTGTFLQAPGARGESLTLGDAWGKWTIDPAPQPGIATVSTIYDSAADLYAGLEDPITPGSKITAVSESYNFQIAELSPGNYVIYPPDQDFYWFSNASIKPSIEVEHASGVSGNAIYFNFEPALE